MLHELFITHCTNGTSIMNPFTTEFIIKTVLALLTGCALNHKFVNGVVLGIDHEGPVCFVLPVLDLNSS